MLDSPIVGHDRGGRQRRTLWAIVAVIMAGAIALALGLHAEASGTGHGRPDPGGRRLASIRGVAPHALPAGVFAVRTRVHTYRWDTRTCDGGAPGWTDADVDQDFKGPATVVARFDERMHELGWKQRPAAKPISGIAPVQLPKGMREYEPRGSNPYNELATLTPPSTYGEGRWDLDIDASPAMHPSHDC